MHDTIELKNVSKEFLQGPKRIVLFQDGLYTFKQGQTYALTGVSGTGKSTLLHMLAGIEAPTSGSVCFDGVPYQPGEINPHVGIIFQYAYLLPELSVLENVALKGYISGLSEELARNQAQELLNQVGLLHKAEAFPAALSGGEQQRVSIARALMLRPAFILADEPTAHLDEENKRLIMELLLSCSKLFGAGLIVSSHDPFVIEKMDNQLTIFQGTLCHG